MKKFMIIAMLVLGTGLAQAQKIRVEWLDKPEEITSITIINRGDDPMSIVTHFALGFGRKGVKVKTQTNIGENTTITSESVKSEHALTFEYLYNGYGLAVLVRATLIDVESGSILGIAEWRGMRRFKKVVPKMVNEILQ